MLKNGQKFFKCLAVFTLQDFQYMPDHFSQLCMEGLLILSLHHRVANNIQYENTTFCTNYFWALCIKGLTFGNLETLFLILENHFTVRKQVEYRNKNKWVQGFKIITLL